MKIKLSLAILCMLLAPSYAQNLRNLGITPTATSLPVGTPSAPTPEVGNIVVDQKTTPAPAASTTQQSNHPNAPVDPRFKVQNSTEHLNGTDPRSWPINGTKSENTPQKVTAESIKAKEDQQKGWKPEQIGAKQSEDKQGSSSLQQDWRDNGQKRDVSQKDQQEYKQGFQQEGQWEGPEERQEGKFIQRGQERQFFKGNRKGEETKSEKGRKERKHSDQRQLKIRGDFTHLEVEFGSVDHDGSSEERNHGKDERKTHEEQDRLHAFSQVLPKDPRPDAEHEQRGQHGVEGKFEQKGQPQQKGQQGLQIESKARYQSGPIKLYVPNDKNITGNETQVHPQRVANQTQQAGAVKKQGEDYGQYFQQFNQNLQIFDPLHQQPKQGEIPQHQVQSVSVHNSTVEAQSKPAA